jgi:hypothetical protein
MTMAKTLVIEIDDCYCGALSVTVIGAKGLQTMVSTTAIDLLNTKRVMVDATGQWRVEREVVNGKAD